ncbi:hypothetical protein ACFOSV_03260 [Algoriphagus namhaensis]|uniref:Uncharacterized protein n=1 Tax=Algoriphagus namhaensis TaxID=915353 RepID=A0ABV8ANI6_9BACT
MKSLFATLFFFLLGILQPAADYIDAKNYDINTMHRGNQASKSPKRIYIQNFRAFFEVYEEATASTSGSKNDRANRTSFVSGTKTSLGVQIDGVDVPDFQKIVDEAYADLVAQLEADGFEIISADEAGKTDYYSGYTKMKGGASSTAQAKGFVMVTPTNYEYWVKSVSKDGKERGTFTDTSSKLSGDLEDAYVAEATFIFPFVTLDASSSNWTNSSSVKADIGLRLASIINVDDNDQKSASLTGFAKSLGNAATGSQIYSSRVRIIAGDKINNPTFDASTGLKKDVYFEDVFEDRKIKEVTTAQVDNFSKGAYPTLVMVSGDELTLASHYANCDPAKYLGAVKGSMSEMIQTGLTNFKELREK